MSKTKTFFKTNPILPLSDSVIKTQNVHLCTYLILTITLEDLKQEKLAVFRAK